MSRPLHHCNVLHSTLNPPLHYNTTTPETCTKLHRGSGSKRGRVAANCTLWKLQTLQNIHSPSYTFCKLHTLLTANCAKYTLSKLHILLAAHIANCTYCKLYALQTSHSANYILCKLHTLKNTHSAKYTFCKLHTLKTIHITNFTLCKLSQTVWAWRRRKAVGGKGGLTDSLTHLINDEAVCRAGRGFARVC